jgi:hypothetical protein
VAATRPEQLQHAAIGIDLAEASRNDILGDIAPVIFGNVYQLKVTGAGDRVIVDGAARAGDQELRTLSHRVPRPRSASSSPLMDR